MKKLTPNQFSFPMRLRSICMITQHHTSFNKLTSVYTPPPARLAWRQTRSFRPAGLEENFPDRMSQSHCIYGVKGHWDFRICDLVKNYDGTDI